MSAMQAEEIAEKVLMGGKMGALIHSHDWSQTPLGSVETWLQSLKTALNILCNVCCPMFLVWGSERILFYNDAYATLLGESDALIPFGQSINESTNVTWSRIGLEVEQVFSTGLSRSVSLAESFKQEHPSSLTEQDLNLQASYNWCYSPLWDETGTVGGVFATGYRVIPNEAPTAVDAIAEPLWQRGKQLRLMMNALPVLIAYVDKDHYYRFNNETYSTWFGQPGATLTGRHVRDVLGETAYEAVRPYMDQALAGLRVSYESQISYHDGGTRHIQADYVPHINSQGQVEGFFGLVSDISERKRVEDERNQAEAALRNSEEDFRAMFNVTSVGMAQADAKTRRLVRVNAAFCAITGYTEAELLTLTVDEINHPEDRDRDRERFINLVQGEELTYQSEKRYLRKDGSTVWVFVTGNVIRDAQEQTVRVVTVIQDITERKQAETALRESEERFRYVTQAVNGLIFDWNLQTNQVYRSEKLYELVGIDAKNVPQNASWWQERIHPDDQARLQPEITELFASTHRIFDTEYRVRHQDGHWVDVREQACWLRDEQGQIIRIVGCTVDISDRKRIEEALKTSEERLRFAVEGAALGTWEYDLASGEIVWSERSKIMFGVPLNAQVDYDVFIHTIHPDDRDRIDAAVERAIAEQDIYDVEMRSVWADGSIHWIRSIGRARYNQQGEPTRMIGVAFDITNRKRAEENLQKSERRFRRLAESNMFGVAFGDFSGGIHYVNDYFLNMVGYSREEIESGQVGWIDMTPTEFLPLEEKALAELRTQGVTKPFQKEYICKDGSRVPVFIGLALLQEPHDQQQGIVAFHLNLTEQKQAEAERERLLKQAQIAREEAETANRIKDEFLAVLSHELRSPLNPILGWSRLLQTRSFDEQSKQRALQTIERNAKLQTQLIEDLLDVSRILRGKMALNISPVNLVTVIESALETVRLAAEAKRIQIQSFLTSENVRILGDSTRIQQIIWNLLSNAVKFTDDGGQVEVRLSLINAHQAFGDTPQITHYAQIQVKDTGKGINSDFLPYVFDYFRQEDGKITRQFGGLGLGLAIVRRLTELHGGTVHAESPGLGQGATFVVRLPVMTSTTEFGKKQPATPQEIDLSQLQVLLVDDEPDMRDLVKVILEHQGMQVRVASSATEALMLFDQQQPDILISDIGMPEVDGYTLMQQIRTRPPEQGGLVKAIALTAYAGEYDQQQALKVGFQGHLAKPIEPEELIKAIAFAGT